MRPDRVLATVLFTDIVDSTSWPPSSATASGVSCAIAMTTLSAQELARFRGREVKTLGDGFLATFDGPARAVRCAAAIIDKVRPLGMEVRGGLHTGEIEIRGMISAASPSTSRRASPKWPAPARCSSPVRYVISLLAQVCASTTGAVTQRRVCRSRCDCLLPRREAPRDADKTWCLEVVDPLIWYVL